MDRPHADPGEGEGEGASANDATPAAATWGTTATGHIRQYANFLEAVRTHQQPAVTGEDGRNAVEIVTAAYESSRTGRSIELQAVAR